VRRKVVLSSGMFVIHFCISQHLFHIKAAGDSSQSSVPIEIRVMEEAKSVEVTSKHSQFADCDNDDDDQREGKVNKQQHK